MDILRELRHLRLLLLYSAFLFIRISSLMTHSLFSGRILRVDHHGLHTISIVMVLGQLIEPSFVDSILSNQYIGVLNNKVIALSEVKLKHR